MFSSQPNREMFPSFSQAVRMTDEAPNPVYVSVGHKISLNTAVKLALACAIKRIPEPIRQASSLIPKP